MTLPSLCLHSEQDVLFICNALVGVPHGRPIALFVFSALCRALRRVRVQGTAFGRQRGPAGRPHPPIQVQAPPCPGGYWALDCGIGQQTRDVVAWLVGMAFGSQALQTEIINCGRPLVAGRLRGLQGPARDSDGGPVRLSPPAPSLPFSQSSLTKSLPPIADSPHCPSSEWPAQGA